MRVVSSSAASVRLAAARAFLAGFPADSERLVVGATRGAADDLVRGLAGGRSSFGLHRFSLIELAARAAAAGALRSGSIAGTATNAEAMAARAAFDALAGGQLSYFGPVARTPGFPKALARTIHELRMAGSAPESLAMRGVSAGDLSRLLARIESDLDAAAVSDRAALFARATDAWRAGLRWHGCPILLLDVPLNSIVERRFADVVIRTASDALITCPAGDEATRDAFGRDAVDDLDDDAVADTDLGRLRRYLFTEHPPPERPRTYDVRLFSAPGEGREALEIARIALDRAADGVRFDEMAICLRATQPYLGLLEHALSRAGVPAFFDRGTRRPDPAGRAFVAILSCACEKLSAKRFDEYLSLGQVPRIGSPPSPASASIPDDEAYERFNVDTADEQGAGSPSEPETPDSDSDAIIAGTLRAPWKWEELIVESAVIGGVNRLEGKRRWRRRLDGLAAEYAVRLDELCRQEPESPRIAGLKRDLRNLAHLRSFALPVIDVLAGWPDESTWGEWLDRFSEIAPRVLARPARVLRVLAELRPMAAIGPVPLEEARDVLQDRLLTLDWDPAPDRYGRIFVGTPHQLRGRAFRVVFVPGLAERVFPERVREDPLLPDKTRRENNAGLVTKADRTSAERLLLRLAVGAATERLYLSYPRIGSELGEMRPRVPSFYALDVMRAITGRIPDHRLLAAEAAEEAGASLAWPAPRDPARAIDDFEHDLAILKPLIDTQDESQVRGHARYLLELNEALRRSVISRWSRGRARWSTSDGLIAVTPATRQALDKNRLGRRPYSVSALQRFATCPYQFLLAAIHRLEVWEEPQPVVRMDPLTRGSLFHRAQAEFLRELQQQGDLPVTTDNLPRVAATLQVVVNRVASEYAEQLAPAIERVWRDEIDELRRDLGIWARKLAAEPEWVPEYFEFSFGLSDEGRDPRSLPDPVRIDDRFVLRGSVDLIERRSDGALRITDHKTGKNRSRPGMVVGGGAVLQPVIYSLAIERGLGQRVAAGRLYFCTTPGGFAEQPVPIDDFARAQGIQVLQIVDRAIELGALPAAPAKDACRWCDFRTVCGPDVERRSASKPAALVADLLALREAR